MNLILRKFHLFWRFVCIIQLPPGDNSVVIWPWCISHETWAQPSGETWYSKVSRDSNCNLYFVSVLAPYGMASFMRPIWLKSNLCNAIPTTCLVTIEIQRGCCQKGHLKMIHIYQCLFVPYSDFPYFWFWKLIWYNKLIEFFTLLKIQS